MTYGPRRIPWASEAREEAWLEWAGEQAKDAINDALTRWEPNEVLDAVRCDSSYQVTRFEYYEDEPAIAIINKLSSAIDYLKALSIVEAIRVCDKMKLSGDWEYSDDWDPRSF